MQIIPPISEKHEKDAALYRATGKLIINNLKRKTDAGLYKCTVAENSHDYPKVFSHRVKNIIGKD